MIDAQSAAAQQIELFTHALPHWRVPVGHWHAPALQTLPATAEQSAMVQQLPLGMQAAPHTF